MPPWVHTIWVYHQDPSPKTRSGSVREAKGFKTSVQNLMATIFWHDEGVLLMNYLQIDKQST